ncbi:MAG: YggS family pyridoxal phosphate-dependent enzyme [Burkholderiales bacterium]
MTTIGARLQAVQARIERAARAAGRPPKDIRLVAVSKTFPAETIRQGHEAGQHDFGENYLQEAVGKIESLRDLLIDWHYIGPIQSNKTRQIAERFSWVHSVDRLKIGQRLSEGRPAALGPLDVCIQVNVSGEASKSGVAPGEAAALARELARLPRLRLRGLMTVPEATADVAVQRSCFSFLRDLKDRIVASGLPMDTLSMGMTDDLESAIAEGATMVRVGRAIFGERDKARR